LFQVSGFDFVAVSGLLSPVAASVAKGKLHCVVVDAANAVRLVPRLHCVESEAVNDASIVAAQMFLPFKS
jgi:hypothetical protein